MAIPSVMTKCKQQQNTKSLIKIERMQLWFKVEIGIKHEFQYIGNQLKEKTNH